MFLHANENRCEIYKSNRLTQCFNCQRFGHSSLHCGFTPKYLKCVVSYKVNEYPKTPEEEPEGTNYEGSHTEKFKKFPTIIQAIATKPPSKTNNIRPTNPNQEKSTTSHSPTAAVLSYGSIANQEKPKLTLNIQYIVEQLQIRLTSTPKTKPM